MYIDVKLEEYNKALATAEEDNTKVIEEEIKKQQDRKDNYQNIQEKLEQTGEVQISTSDPDSRQIMTRNNISEVVYNV